MSLSPCSHRKLAAKIQDSLRSAKNIYVVRKIMELLLDKDIDNITAPNILGYENGTLILGTTHILPPKPCTTIDSAHYPRPQVLDYWPLGTSWEVLAWRIARFHPRTKAVKALGR